MHLSRLPGFVQSLALLLLLALPAAAQTANRLPADRVQADPVPSDTAGFRLQTLRYTYPGIDLRVAYPELSGTTPAVKAANRILREYARQRMDTFKAEAFEGLRLMRTIDTAAPARPRRKSANRDLYASETIRVWRPDSQLAAVLFSAEFFFGGAHPANEEHAIVLDLSGDKARALENGDLFNRDCPSDSILRAGYIRSAMVAEQGRSEPRFPQEQLVAAVGEHGIEATIPTSAGLLLVGRPLPRYIGPVVGVIPYADLASCIPPSSPIARFVGSGN